MIVVTGTKRSGTSMWMQILEAGGVEPIGEKFPLDWGTRLRELNPRGFYESRLRSGINFTSNPDPETGHYLAPRESERSAIKIFAPGVICTDVAFLDRVIGTMRDWRAYVRSRRRLEELDIGDDVPDEVRFAARYNLPAHLEWWVENYALLRDAMLRRYAFTYFTYESIVGGELDLIDGTFDWIGFGDAAAAREVVETREIEPVVHVDVDIEPEVEAMFDEFYRRVHVADPVDDEFIEALDATHEKLLPQIEEHLQDSQAAVMQLVGKRQAQQS